MALGANSALVLGLAVALDLLRGGVWSAVQYGFEEAEPEPFLAPGAPGPPGTVAERAVEALCQCAACPPCGVAEFVGHAGFVPWVLLVIVGSFLAGRQSVRRSTPQPVKPASPLPSPRALPSPRRETPRRAVKEFRFDFEDGTFHDQ